MEFTDDESPDYSLASPAAARDAHLPASCSGMRLDQALAREFPEFSRSRLKQWIEAGRVTVDGNTSDPKRKVWGGEHVLFTPELDPEVSSSLPEAIPLNVVFEDAHLFVIDKPAGLVVHPGAGNWGGTLLNALLALSPACAGLPRGGIVHRLDKETSGLMVVARTLEAQTSLVRQLQDHSVSRHYLAVVYGDVRTIGTVDAPVGRHRVQRTRMAVTPHGKPARTHYRPIRGGAGWTLVECRLDTGRTHQIRVHMESIKHPILGDPVYGPRAVAPALAARLAGFPRQALHARRLELVHPATGETLAWESPVPDDFAALLARLEAP
jgi:23S rRNA pseudouridine1911/1915/1917 synthase